MYFFEKKKSNNFQRIHYYTILCYSLVSSVQKRKEKQKEKVKKKKKKPQAAWFFFHIMLEGHISEAHYLSNWYQNEFKQHVACYSVIQSSIEPNFFSVERKLQKWIHLSIRHCYFFEDLPHYLFDKKLSCLIRISLKVTPVFISFDEIRKNYILKLLYYRVHLAQFF